MAGKKSLVAWNCAACTFEHQAPAPRCAMCGALRVATKAQMRDFVQGKPVPVVPDGNVVELASPPTPPDTVGSSNMTATKEATTATATTTTDQPANIGKPRAANPYFKKRTAPPQSEEQDPQQHQQQQQNATLNPYFNPAKQSANNAAASAATRPTAGTSRQHSASIPQPTSNSTTTPADSWHELSVHDARSRTTLALNPPAPPRQSPPRQAAGAPAPAAHHAASNFAATTTATSATTRPTPNININSALMAAPAMRTLKPPPPASTVATTTIKPKRPARKSLTTQKVHLKSKLFKSRAYVPGPVPLCGNTKDSWIYPKHPLYPTRQYQMDITKTAVQYNTLVSLPTGLGKTLIAAVVMYNYWRWFPTGKIIFLAPTLPLVNQQVQACYKIMGIPETDTAILTGKLSKDRRRKAWKEQRVFYCTPQTVQKDLQPTNNNDENADENENDDENATFPDFANQVVCLVLDEAHKATGEYAYVKVVEQLEQAGAMFRVVGLSATPGTSIKAIQSVIGALRASKIEARHESDPTVQPYLHEKHMELVYIQKNSVQKEIEQILTRMLDPHLTNLRNEGGIRLNGNQTLTSFQLVQAQRDYAQKNNGAIPGYLLGLYAVVRKLNGLRNDARESLGILKSNLIRLRNDPQRGLLSKVVKSVEFNQLVQRVLGATNSHHMETSLSQQQASHGAVHNNPKLSKLMELLKEHFSRAAACGKGSSSKVIVFSQLRDSVAEIVLVLRTLEPTVRPHHFVGQGKPPSNSKSKKKRAKDSDSGGIDALKGMKQAEQQAVIQEFRRDVYNVLVCTCIGEEGLDIGEVDLIVNYDTLRSPIRMIQRTGRTGRARDGRVVCLVNEGQERRTYEQSKVAEKTLMRALSNKDFRMTIHIPLLPEAPELKESSMEITNSQLHLSQVVGANLKSVRSATTGRGTKGKKASSSRSSSRYKLDARQEQERHQRLGNLISLDPSVVSWDKLRNYWVKNRSARNSFDGRAMRILKKMETFGAVGPSSTKSRRSRPQVPVEVLTVFPLDPPRPAVQVTKEGGSSEACQVQRKLGFVPAEPTKTTENVDHPQRATDDSASETNAERFPRMPPSPIVPHPPTNRVAGEAIQTNNDIASEIVVDPGQPASQCEPQNAHVFRQDPSGPATNPYTRDRPVTIPPSAARNSCMTFEQTEDRQQKYLTAAPGLQQHTELQPPMVNSETAAHPSSAANSSNVPPQPGDELVFRLPTPPPSSSEDDGDNLNEDEESLTSLRAPQGQLESKIAAFRLPTPPPSSSEDESDAESVNVEEHSQATPHASREQLGNQSLSLQHISNTKQSDPEPKRPLQPLELERCNEAIGANVNGPSHETVEAPDQVSFRLPTQSSSSEEESSCEEDCSNDHNEVAAQTAVPAFTLKVGAGSDDDSCDVPLASFRGKERESLEDMGGNTAVANEDSKEVRMHPEDLSLIHEGASGSESDDPPIISLRTPRTKSSKKKSKKIRIQETPELPTTATQGSTQNGGDRVNIDASDTPERPHRVFVRKRKIVVHEENSQLTDYTGSRSSEKKARGQGSRHSPYDALSWVIQDTPDSQASPNRKRNGKYVCSSTKDLTDTPTTSRSQMICKPSDDFWLDPLACCICFSVDSLDADPILICDGCNTGFHRSCLCINIDVKSSTPWFCDQCSDKSRKAEQKCKLCTLSKGPLQQIEPGLWFHPFCRPFQNLASLTSKSCLHCDETGAVRCFSCPSAMHPYCALQERQEGMWTVVLVKSGASTFAAQGALFCPDHAENVNIFVSRLIDGGDGAETPTIKVIQSQRIVKANKPKRLRKVRLSPLLEKQPESKIPAVGADGPVEETRILKEKRRKAMSRFFHEEADINPDDDLEGDGAEEDEVRRLEDDEISNSSFINDAAELTQHFSQDNLADIDPDAASAQHLDHRALDAQHARENIFKTPVFNRRMQESDSQFTSSSQKGLGNLHFVRSVLEHHRQGGNAEDIENYYRQVAQEETTPQA